MTTLKAIVQDLQQVPPEHLDEVHRVVQSLLPKPTSNEVLAAQLKEILSGTDDLSNEDWDNINEHMRKLRRELFTRPRPEFDDEHDLT